MHTALITRPLDAPERTIRPRIPRPAGPHRSTQENSGPLRRRPGRTQYSASQCALFAGTDHVAASRERRRPPPPRACAASCTRWPSQATPVRPLQLCACVTAHEQHLETGQRVQHAPSHRLQRVQPLPAVRRAVRSDRPWDRRDRAATASISALLARPSSGFPLFCRLIGARAQFA